MGLTQQQKLDAWRAKKAAEKAAQDAKVRGYHRPSPSACAPMPHHKFRANTRPAVRPPMQAGRVPMKRVVANYGRPHAKRPVETTGGQAQPKRSRSPVPDPVHSSLSTNPLVQRAQAGGAGFGSYVDTQLASAQSSRMGPTGAAGGSATRQLKEHLKEQLETEERRAAGANGSNNTPAETAAKVDTSLKPRLCDIDVQLDAPACPATSTAGWASTAVQVDTVSTIAIETQTEPSPELLLDPPISCGTQTDPPTEMMVENIGCQCDGEHTSSAVHPPSTDESTLEEELDAGETAALDPFAFQETEEETAAPAPATEIDTQRADAQRAEEVAQRKEELLAESAANAERAALAEASEAVIKLEKAQGQIVNLEFANDLLVQQVGDVKNQLKNIGSKELAARHALTKLQQDHQQEVARWQKMMDSTVQSVQGQMQQLLEGTTQKISALQQQVQHKDAQIAHLLQQCAQWEASAEQAAAAETAAASADGLGNEAEMDADAIFAAVDSVEEEEEEEEEEEDGEGEVVETRHEDEEMLSSEVQIPR